MAVIAVLMSIMSPALSSIRESARQVVCRSNMRQIGIGIAMYAEENRDWIPPSVNATSTITGEPWDTMDLRLDGPGPGVQGPWDGLGYMFILGYLPAPKLYYCPSHHGGHPYADYASAWGGAPDGIVGNFQYRAAGIMRKPSTALRPPTTTYLSRMLPESALVSDGMRTQDDFNHRIGANVLRAGGSVDWWRDPGNFLSGLPKDEAQVPPQNIQDVWLNLDEAH